MVTKQKPGPLTLRDLITRFLGRRNLSPRTVDYYSNILSHLQRYAGQNDWPEQVENITRGHIRDFLDYVATERHRWPEGRRSSYEKASPATVHHYGKVVKTFLHWAEDEAQQPIRASLKQIIQYAEEYPVVATAIDAQITWSTSDEKGFRTSDYELRRLLPNDCRNWVASQNSLAAVPVRGRQLAECLSPIVGTIIETHPRACLFFAHKSLLESVKSYKKANAQPHRKKLWKAWANRFAIDVAPVAMDITDDALDSIVCATLAYLFHHSPQQLQQLPYSAADKRGRGPFFILRPISENENAIIKP